LKSGDGERLPGERQTFVKASPRTGTQGVELFRDSMAAGASTGIHVHQQADEFFYVISGRGFALVDGNEVPIETDDFVFVPKGREHRVKTAGPTPLELVFLVDRPGLASDFRESRSEEVARKRRLTLDERNRISKKYGTVRRTLE
jgi:mannose-6-phosphate isomerase-like protein (cupin superfamily)